METKILFADIDGTLLNDQKEIPKENMTAIQKSVRSWPLCGCGNRQTVRQCKSSGKGFRTDDAGMLSDCLQWSDCL